jgi:precorrin-8X/cobalt-precorrin-8 methylmutase
MKKALLLVDRGSREQEVGQELREICELTKQRAGYDYSDYCFLEVLPPYIEAGLNKCVGSGADLITVMPYFLYPGMKLKDTVKQSARIGHHRNLRMVIARPLSYHPVLTQIVIDRLTELKERENIAQEDGDCDVLLIGHGSSDRNAREAFIFVANSIKGQYRKVHFCFLELDHPDIEEGISLAVSERPGVILLMPYFLHKGAHIKRDVINEIASALQKHRFKNVFLARHLGVDEKLVDLVIERAKEVESRVNGGL